METNGVTRASSCVVQKGCVIGPTLRTIMIGVAALALSGCYLSGNESISAHAVQRASPCVRQFMAAYAEKYDELLTYTKLGRAKYACRLLAEVRQKKQAYPANGCVGKRARYELRATPAQMVSWLAYPSKIGFLGNYYAIGYEPSIHNLISWSSLRGACRGKANTAAQVAALESLKSAQRNTDETANSPANQKK